MVRIQSQAQQKITQIVLLRRPAAGVDLDQLDRIERGSGGDDGNEPGFGGSRWRRRSDPTGLPPAPT
jgi:hypothetical protein